MISCLKLEMQRLSTSNVAGSNVAIYSIAKIFRDYIIDANGLTSKNSYKHATTKLERLEFGLGDVLSFAGMISGQYFSDKANYWTAGIFVSAAINKIIKSDETATLEFSSLGCAADCIGYRLDRGNIVLHGDAGDYLGEEMSGGTITVLGNAGYYAGFCMSGGKITVDGDAGGHLGTYMSGGTIDVHGRIGSVADSCKGRISQNGSKKDGT